MSYVHAPFGGWDHDSLQFHFFCAGRVGAARVFRTNSLSHISFWLYDGTRLARTHESSTDLKSDDRNLDVSASGLGFIQQDGRVVIQHEGVSLLELEPRGTLKWNDTLSTVIHQVQMTCRLRVGDEWIEGLAYCKRYSWTPAPRHWGYRFIQGYTDDHYAVWTAEATFGTQKYDYFKLMQPDGTVVEADENSSTHRQNGAYARIRDKPASVNIEEAAVWEAPLVSKEMDSRLRQRVCRLTIDLSDRQMKGWAINETCYGTLG